MSAWKENKIKIWKFIVHIEDWLSSYVDDPLLTEIIATEDFEIAMKKYDEQKLIANSNGLRHEINISIYFDGGDFAYISDTGELRSLDYFDIYDFSSDEIKEKLITVKHK
ncbi:MAG: hypothetical protein L0M06_12320 [Enterococcus sp.]|nr:hypothetical protein [Enterococcus sp.]